MKALIEKAKQRFETRSVLALAIRSGALHVSLVNYAHGSTSVGKTFTVPVGADQIVVNPDGAGKELTTQLLGNAIRERRCVVCMPASWALTTSTEVPALTGDDLRGYLELRAEKEFPIAVNDLRLAHCSFRVVDQKSRATLAGVPAKRVDAIHRMLAAAGCKAVSLSFGVDRCLTEAPTQPAVHFLANGNHVDVVITAGGGIAGMRSLPTTPAPRDPGFDATGFCRELRITLGRLPEPVRQHVQAARFGGTATSAEQLCSKTREQLNRMGITGTVSASTLAHDQGEGAAIESAEKFLRGEPIAFEFVSPEVNRWQVLVQQLNNRGRRTMLLGGIGAIALAVLTFFIRSHIESSLQREWDQMGRDVADLETLQQKIRQFRPWFEPTPQGLDAFEVLAGAFPDQGDVWAKSIQIVDGSKVVCTGFARNQAALMGLLDRLRARKDISGLQVQQVRGDNPVQFSVTYKREAQHGN
jgi:hypothetical protein